jgi:hypothetical protein
MFQPNSPQPPVALHAFFIRVDLPDGPYRESVVAHDIFEAKTDAAAKHGVPYEAVTILQTEDD